MRHVALALVLALSIHAPDLRAQTSSDEILAHAEIIGALTVVGKSDLNFGSMLGSTTVVVAVTEPGAGKFEVQAQPGAEVQVEFTQLPTAMTKEGAADVFPLTLTAAHSEQDNPSGATSVDPAAGPWTAIFPVSGKAFVWVGGTVQPPAGQAVGAYVATIELSIQYTGN